MCCKYLRYRLEKAIFEPEGSFMPAVGHFLELLEAVSRRDWTSVADVVRVVAEAERKQRHFGAAHQLLQALDIATSDAGYDRVGTVAFSTPEPAAPPLDYLHRVRGTDVEAPALPNDRELAVREFIAEWQNEARLRAAGLAPRHTALMYGPPGCGKTHLARFIAQSLGMALYVVRFDSLVSSYLGETASNLQRVFEFFSANRCVVLIDEIDAIAKLRDDRNELGELKRVVISLLQNIDYAETRSLLIAATNHPHLLDPALWRRFDVTWEIAPPSEEHREHIIRRLIDLSGRDAVARVVVTETAGCSGADIVQIGTDAKRKLALDPTMGPGEAVLLSLLNHLRRREGAAVPRASEDTVRRVALALREHATDAKYSFKRLEALTGIPHSTLHHQSKAATA
jgi:MoxR-like ATPase